MSHPSRKLWVLFAALAIALALPALAAAPAEGNGINEGTDCWQTQPGTQATLFLPLDACGPGSKPEHVTVALKGVPLSVADAKACGCQVDTKITYLDPHGNVLAEKTVHAVKQITTETTKVDTCVRRTKNAKFHGKGVAEKVDIQLVQLSLQSEKPLTCTYKAGPPKTFTICVTESGPQDTGTMTFTPTTLGRLAKGNAKLEQLHITYDVTFMAAGGSCAELPKGALFTLKNQKLTLKNGRRPGTFEQVSP
ncbi:MAG: hypothetical protein E6J34_01385 [Chloroflexi bacterium]|nr:MAG: hypothetical protein E6J34_01385 [Chloroflexota bacterium]